MILLEFHPTHILCYIVFYTEQDDNRAECENITVTMEEIVMFTIMNVIGLCGFVE